MKQLAILSLSCMRICRNAILLPQISDIYFHSSNPKKILKSVSVTDFQSLFYKRLIPYKYDVSKFKLTLSFVACGLHWWFNNPEFVYNN